MDIKRNSGTMATQKLTPISLLGLSLTKKTITGLPSEFCEKILTISDNQIIWMDRLVRLGVYDEINK